jgi:metal-responsive CopG/Arc/MetJ family transcriptional regulator
MTVTKTPLVVSVDESLFEKIDQIKETTKRTRSSIVNELFILGIEEA